MDSRTLESRERCCCIVRFSILFLCFTVNVITLSSSSSECSSRHLERRFLFNCGSMLMLECHHSPSKQSRDFFAFLTLLRTRRRVASIVSFPLCPFENSLLSKLGLSRHSCCCLSRSWQVQDVT